MVFSALLSKNICLILRFLFKVYLGEESRVKGPVNYHMNWSKLRLEFSGHKITYLAEALCILFDNFQKE